MIACFGTCASGPYASRLHRGRRFAARLLVASCVVLLAACTAAPSRTDTPAASLAGSRWRVTAIHEDARGVLAPVLPEATVTLAFADDGRASGSAGCNRYTTGYAAEGSRLAFRGGATTRMACPGVEIMGQEQAFLKALERVAAARRTGDRLELLDASGRPVLALAREGG